MTLTELLTKFDELSGGQGLHYNCDGKTCDCDEITKQFFSSHITEMLQGLKMEKEEFNGYDVSDSEPLAEAAHEGYSIAVEEQNNKIEQTLR